jgi:hypothetical protein
MHPILVLAGLTVSLFARCLYILSLNSFFRYISHMKAASIQEIKKELATLTPSALSALCLRLARFKKENKELLTYLLFESGDEQAFISSVKKEIEEQFTEINRSQLYFVKKSLRKILKLINRYSRYSGSAQTETELRIHFCATIKENAIPIHRDKALNKLYQTQVAKIKTIISAMHEDLQYDFERSLKALE